MEEGIQKDLREGIQKGKAEGKTETLVHVAKIMLADGELIEKISHLTGLTQEELGRLKNKIDR